MIILAIIIIVCGLVAVLDEDWIWGAVLIFIGATIGYNQIKDPTIQEQREHCEDAGFFWQESGNVILEGDDYVAEGECVKDIP